MHVLFMDINNIDYSIN